MFKRILDLLIAVTLGYAILGFAAMFVVNGDKSSLVAVHWASPDEKFLLYVVPAITLIMHVVQVAHYHQKRHDWKVEQRLATKIDGFYELLNIVWVAVPAVALLSATQMIDKPANRHYLIGLFFVTYLFYWLGDVATKIAIVEEQHLNGEHGWKIRLHCLFFRNKKEQAKGRVPDAFIEAAHVLIWSDFVVMCSSFALLWAIYKGRLTGSWSLTLLSAIIIVTTSWNYYWAHKFLLGEPPKDSFRNGRWVIVRFDEGADVTEARVIKRK